MIDRRLGKRLRKLARIFPVVTVTGPRQSGKTTLCRSVFPGLRYVSLEAPDVREFARTDPRAFLGELKGGAILDEVQRVPELLSYLQGAVDEGLRPGRFVLTGSANFSLMQSVTQSLAGRTAALHLLPCGLDELRGFPDHPQELWNAVWTGAYPAIFDRRIPPREWYQAYVATYVERDVRQILNVTDLAAFQVFIRLSAGRTGQLLNLSQLGAECGLSHNTARAWMSLLETSFLVHRLPPFHANVGKRLVKMPKLYFLDTGLACFLLGIRSADEVVHHPLRGALFETWVVSEILKARLHDGLAAGLSFYRDSRGRELDLLVETKKGLSGVEVKSSSTVASDFFRPLNDVALEKGIVSAGGLSRRFLVYGGDDRQKRSDATVVPWSEVAGIAS